MTVQLRASSFANAEASTELASVLRSCRATFIGVGLFSGVINILMLTGALFMLEIYDRVLPSRSLPTLIGLGILVLLLFSLQGLLDLVRSRILVRVGAHVDEALRGKVLHALLRIPLLVGNQSGGAQPIRDLENVRSFLSGPGPIAFFDLPWLPVYLIVIFAFHIWLGVTALVGAIILVGLTFLTEVMSRAPMACISTRMQARTNFAESCRRNAEVITAMGMGQRVDAKWQDMNRRYLSDCQQVSDVTGGFGAFSKVLRMVLQSAVLAVGAFLVIEQEATAGIIIAASILAGRALAPVDLAISQYKSFLGARQSWARLNTMLALLPQRADPLPLPAPESHITLREVYVAAPGTRKPIVESVSFTIEAGSALGIIGPTGSGKSSLLRAIVGVWQPLSGRVRLDGADLDQWSAEHLGRNIGYLPQDVELFSGTISENIARFDAKAEPESIIAAAKAAGVHDLIVSLREGYDTQIGEQGQVLSAGQRQRVALARALYGDPFLVVLDEPNSNLDGEGEVALNQAILGVRKRGGIVLIVAHRPSALVATNWLLAIDRGRMQAFGEKDAVLATLFPKLQSVTPEAPRVVSENVPEQRTGT